jgi:hypothetical protein
VAHGVGPEFKLQYCKKKKKKYCLQTGGQNRSCLGQGVGWEVVDTRREEEMRKGCGRVNIVQDCVHWKNGYQLKLFQEWGERG